MLGFCLCGSSILNLSKLTGRFLPSSFPWLVTAFLQDGNCQKDWRIIGISTREYWLCLPFRCLNRSPLLFPFDLCKFSAAKYNTKLITVLSNGLRVENWVQPPHPPCSLIITDRVLQAQLCLAGTATAEQRWLQCPCLGNLFSVTAPVVYFPMGNDVFHRFSETRFWCSNHNVHSTEQDLLFW